MKKEGGGGRGGDPGKKILCLPSCFTSSYAPLQTPVDHFYPPHLGVPI